ncbi:MAG: CBS domain-containing protein [Bradyrhizobiaceae bacterium]|nr:MAG: CBS domain-containing protein [Bradyrhizobiaceae bacterium]
MRADQVMNAPVISVTPETPVVEAAGIMLQHHISGLPVIDTSNRLVGIVSEGDFLRRGEIGTQKKRGRWLSLLLGPGREALDFVRAQGRKVGEIMSPDPLTIAEETPLDDIVRLMERNNVKRLPVMRGDELVGIVTRSNLLQAVASLARDTSSPTGDDRQLRAAVRQAIEKNEWCPSSLDIIVRNGVVQLGGIITDERSRQATIVAAENVRGVKEVHDHLCWIDPMSGMYLNSPEDDQAARSGKSR